MAAFDDFISYSSVKKFNEYRQSLVSHKRGTLSSGNFPQFMNLTLKDESEKLFDDVPSEPAKLFQRVGKLQQPGFIFDLNGTERAMSIVSNNGKLKLYEEFSDLLKFSDNEKRDCWNNAKATTKKKCISKNVQDLIKKTDINYRTHGDRLHYFVVGLITLTEKNDVRSYPLFLFSCSDVDKNTMQVEVEASGFVNFWLDKYYLENILVQTFKGYEITLDDNFATKINDVARKLNTYQSAGFDSISCDSKYSSVSIVTGFEAEYIDPAWGKILGDQV